MLAVPFACLVIGIAILTALGGIKLGPLEIEVVTPPANEGGA
jgi:hypothetical protein